MDLSDYVTSIFGSLDFWIALASGLLVIAVAAVFRFAFGRAKKKCAPDSTRKSVDNTCMTAFSSGNGNTIALVNSEVNMESAPRISGPSNNGAAFQPSLSMMITQRLTQVIEAINDRPMFSKPIDAVYIARNVCHDDDFEKVEQYLNGTAVQSFKFLDEFSEYFGVNREWIESGERAPFPMRRVSSPLECLKVIEETKPRSVYFVLDNSERKRAALILEISEYAYETVSSGDWPLALRTSTGQPNVGGGGRSNILEFYQLAKKVYAFGETRNLYQGRYYLSHICDIVISKEDMEQLIEGRAYPKLIIYKNGLPGNSQWADDLRDIDWKCCRGRDEYRKIHGDWFIETQEFIKTRVRRPTG